MNSEGGIALRKAILVVLALAMVVCASAALAQQGPPPGGPPMGPGQGRQGMGMGSCPVMAIAPPPAMMIERIGDTLGLTADQKDKLVAALTKNETALMPLRQKSGEASKALHDAVFAPTFDAAKVNELLAAAQKAEAAVAMAEIQAWSDIRAILSADQITKLNEAMTRRGGNRGGGGGGRNRPQPGAPGGPGPGPAPEPPPAPGQ